MNERATKFFKAILTSPPQEVLVTLNTLVRRADDNYVVGDPITFRFGFHVLGLSDYFAERFEAFDWEALEKQEKEPIDVIIETLVRVLGSEFTGADFQALAHAQVKVDRKELERTW